MATVLDRFRAKTKLQQKLLDTLKEQGWTVTVVPFPGAVTFGHPSNDKDIPTPDYAREESRTHAMGAMYPFPTYNVLHQITIMYSVDEVRPTHTDPTRVIVTIKVGTVFRRESSAPWVTTRETAVGLQAAIDYVKSPHPADDPSVPVTTREES